MEIICDRRSFVVQFKDHFLTGIIRGSEVTRGVVLDVENANFAPAAGFNYLQICGICIIS